MSTASRLEVLPANPTLACKNMEGVLSGLPLFKYSGIVPPHYSGIVPPPNSLEELSSVNQKIEASWLNTERLHKNGMPQMLGLKEGDFPPGLSSSVRPIEVQTEIFDMLATTPRIGTIGTCQVAFTDEKSGWQKGALNVSRNLSVFPLRFQSFQDGTGVDPTIMLCDVLPERIQPKPMIVVPSEALDSRSQTGTALKEVFSYYGGLTKLAGLLHSICDQEWNLWQEGAAGVE